MKTSFNKKKKQRIVSLVTALVITANIMPIGGFSGVFSSLFSLTANAVAVPEVDELTHFSNIKVGASPSYSPGTDAEEFENEANSYVSFNSDTNNYTLIFGNTALFVDYCWHYSNTEGFAAKHCNDTLNIAFVGTTELSDGFTGLGTDESPFGGKLVFSGENYQFNAHRALFSYVYDSVRLLSVAGTTENLVVKRLSDVGEGEISPLLADHVRHDTRAGKTSAQWQIELNSGNEKTYSGVIGEIESGAAVKLNYANTSSADEVSATDIGAVCGVMQSGSSMELTYSSATVHSITSSGGNAGGLVGTMNGNASLTIKAMPSVSLNVESAASTAYAGGLVGELTSQATIINQTGSLFSVVGNVTGAGGTGGLFGHYTNSAAEFDLADYNNTAVVSGQYSGGVFGVLENTSSALTIKNTSNAGTLNVKSGTTDNTSGYFGGIAGKYITNALSNSLILDGINVTAEVKAAYGAFGGAIGIVDSTAYIKTENTVTINAKGTTASSYFGGLVGSTGSGGVFVDLGSFTLNANSESFKGGGIVGQFNKGVLRLSGTTDMTRGKPASADNCGQLIGNNDNVLVYAPGTSWTFKRSNGAKTDDLGTWGEVVRGIGETVLDSDAVCFSSTDHTVTISSAVRSMSSPDDFIRTALNIQFNQGSDLDCLKFKKNSSGVVDTANTRATLLASADLSLSADISLAGTGITGFMRDGGAVSDIGCFTGTFDGNDHTITLATGEKYGYGVTSSTASEGVGQIYRHKHNGLFAVLAGTVKELKVNGTINVSNCVDGMNIGGIASRNGGNVTLTKVAADENINYNESSKVTATEGAGKNIGGYIGFVGTNGTININGVSSIGATFELSGFHESWNDYGGAIGKITAANFTVNIGTKGDAANKLTNGLTVSASGITTVGSNGDGGGIIGHITKAGSYGSRIVNLNNVEFSNCAIVNAANENGGGFMGFSWLNSTVNVNSVVVTSGTITNSSVPNVGVMLYKSTGKMTVDGLAINGITMPAGGGTSLGMIVNKAYDGDDGLYLDVLNAGYMLNSNISVSSTVFDEIAAYSASNVISGGNGTGVISINMNADRNAVNASFISTGTYQNRLKTGNACANSYSRYYYNVDKMVSANAGQNLVLWSLKKYAASNIKNEFSSTFDKTLSGNADLTGLSFYPLASANDNYTIGNMTLTFDYSGICSTAESTFGAANHTDSYNRDPASNNQHYLMHSGLFIDQPSGKSLTVNGALTLSGTFLEDGSHKGVIISGTMKGSFVCDSGSIVLDGIKPMNGGNAYTNGYLLINNISRTDDLATPPSVTIKNLRNTDKYSSTAGSSYIESGTTDIVARSLIGAANGKGMTIIFSKIKLDGRDKNKNDTALKPQGLYNAYKTYNSIFSDSTLLASINTDQSAKLEYNFTKADDWGTGSPREVAYGIEIKNSLEYVDEEQRYSPDSNGANNDYVNPVDSSTRTDAQGVYDFTTGFLPYVKTAYNSTQDANGCFKRELKVNVQSVSLNSGCGTYNDPYLINDPKVFEAIAKFISSGETSDLKEVVLPKSPDSNDIISGDRWHVGNDYHATFKASGNDYISVSGSNTWTGSDARKYLASAYYKIIADIELSDKYVGLGYASESQNTTNPANGNFAFRGVIVGSNVVETVGEEQITRKVNITNNSEVPFINVSNGCVVKDINLIVSSSFSLTQNTTAYNTAFFGYYHQCKFYGGIIGEVMGGDNIIDNSYVTYSNSTITLNGTDSKGGTIVPVGGYVGVIVFGGVIFKNMTATDTVGSNTVLRANHSGMTVKYNGKTENLADNDKQEDWAAIYVNPIVGRVINGYAVNETTQFSVTENNKYHNDNKTARTGTTHTLQNGTKHYSIADINKDETNKLDVTAVPSSTSSDGKINIPNSQAFFILSLITQSCAGTAQGDNSGYVVSLSYGTNTTVYGMSHNADYTNVGSATDATDSDFVLARKDTTANTAVPYIIERYCTNHNARCVTSIKGYYDINMTAKTAYNTDSYTYQLPDSFRGLGSVGNYDTYYPIVKKNNNEGQDITEFFVNRANNSFCLKVDVLTGNGCVIDEDTYLNKYQSDNYFNVLHKGVNQDVSSNIQGYEPNTRKNNHGIGLFNSIILKGSDSKLSDFTLNGSINTEIYKNSYKSSKNDQIIKTVADNDNNMWLSVGGVVGWSTNGTGLGFEKIKLNDFSISGSSHIGGLVGFSGLSSKNVKIYISECSADNVTVEMTSAKTNENQQKSRNAIGVFVGKAYECPVVIYGTSNKAENTDNTKFSEVSIKAFSFANPSNQYTVAAGGLVGFAGHCCQIYDMKVSSAGNTVTIGNSKVRFSGGIVGGMQSVTDSANETTCIALFKNCTVENINVEGEYAGGFYGGKWDSAWTPYSITLDNCKMAGKSSKNNITAFKVNDNACAGGFIGRGLVKTSAATNDSNIVIKNCTVLNYNIIANTNGSSKGYAGGFVGYCSSNAGSSTITCYIHDSSVENCIIGASNAYGGGAIGWVKPKDTSHENKMLGYNIKLNNVTSNSGDTMGAWLGYLDNGKISIQFTGMAIYGKSFTKNVGGKHSSAILTNESFVFADYMGKCNGTSSTDSGTEYPTNISGFNFTSGTHVDMPKYPYVNINPQSGIGANEIISGDGAVLYGDSVSGFSGKTADKTIAAKIFADLSDTSNTRRYTTFDKNAKINDDKTIEDYLKAAPGADGDKISTYRTEKGELPTGVDDFAVVVIANQTHDETTDLINRYIQLVTNTSTDYTASSSYYSIDIQTCKFNGTDFVIDTSATNHGLSFTGGKFALNGSYADSNNSTATFTLVDVQFKDPFNTSKIAYHLYVPVYTIKQIEVEFSSAVRTGTYSAKNNSGTNDYSSLMTSDGKHVDGLETWITQYIRYSYKAEDINMLLDSNSLKWNNKKKVIFRTNEASTTFNRLPQDTYMILVDPNGNADREYYAENLSDFETYYDTAHENKAGWIIELSKFKDSSNSNFEVSDLNTLIARSIIETTTGELLYTDGTITDYDAYRIQGNQVKYYKYANGTTGKYHLSVSDDYVLNEDYYISMYVPKASDLYFYEIKAPTEISGEKTAKVNEKNVYTVIAADLYTQDTNSKLTVSPDDQQITASNKTIYVNASTSIIINNTYAINYLNGVDLYHSFDLSLNRYSENGVSNEIIGLAPVNERITATYNIGSEATATSSAVRNIDLQNSHLNIETTEIMSRLISASSNNQPLVVYSYIELDFDETKLENEFPQKGTEGTIGVNVSAASNLAYDDSRLAYTSMSEAFRPQDNHYYYIESVNSAKLDYNAVAELDEYDKIGKMSQNQSALGVNGFGTDCYQEEYMSIRTDAEYNVSAISEEDLAKAEKLRLTLSLSKKTDNIVNGTVTGVEYVQVSDMLNYLYSGVLVTSGTAYGTDGKGVTQTIGANSSSLVVEIPISNCSVADNIYSIGVDLKAKTGVNFTEYANYMVTLRTELIYTDSQTNQVKSVENSGISDYVVYTNAKVFPTLITNAS